MWLYQIFSRLLPLGLRFLALFNRKAALGWAGRKNALAQVKAKFEPNTKVLWMHAASLGEYEQGLPVFLALKAKYPDYQTLISFFSPSGYENIIKKPLVADVVCYLPFDRPKDIKAFLSCFDAKIFFTVKYDYWFNLMQQLKAQACKVYVVSALFYPQQYFFKTYGKPIAKALGRLVDVFFHQTQNSMDLALSLGLNNGVLTGDTRYQRVKMLYEDRKPMPEIEAFLNGEKALIFGSSWQAEEQLVLALVGNVKPKIIIAPHDLGRVEALLKQFGPKAVAYSQLSSTQNLGAQVLVIDNIGLLSKLYQYGLLAVVGGGFHSKGLHNILEAATYGQPVLFGNLYRKNPEADDLMAKNAAKSFADVASAEAFILDLLNQPEKITAMGQAAFSAIHGQADAVAKILSLV
jgi:3-deoxy-D-manno-octulosonic-acid transferase